MSTFDGYVEEFPLIRIDSFRPLLGKPPPLACFLSHVHSDHLAGLESLRSPFVYCSSATREILLRLEPYPHRLNADKGLLEPRIQTYKHLSRVIKPLPLETPTTLELCPGREIQITLFNANHCLGSVMFLIEGQGKSVLYTGDIRCEAWWLDGLTRNPVLLPYASGLRRINKIYLDTTFAAKAEPYNDFPPKAQGIRELLTKLSAYPPSTIFYFRSWTYGYEDVWLAMSNFLKSQIHLDDYRYRVYTSIGGVSDSAFAPCEIPYLAGFRCGNNRQDGILTRDNRVRIHSCAARSRCAAIKDHLNVVEIIPIVSRHKGADIRELGAGGGKSDIDKTPELPLSNNNVKNLQDVRSARTKDGEPRAAVIKKMSNLALLKSTNAEMPHVDISEGPIKLQNPLSLSKPPILNPQPNTTNLLNTPKPKLTRNHNTSIYDDSYDSDDTNDVAVFKQAPEHQLPTEITFPYSRHSSYSELRTLIAAFRPVDIHPCTVPVAEDWSEDLSMESLFGDLCTNPASVFTFDRVMRARHEAATALRSLKRKREEAEAESQPQSDGVETDGEQNMPQGVARQTSELLASARRGDGRSREKAANAAVASGREVDTPSTPRSGEAKRLGERAVQARSLCSAQQARLRARQEAFEAASRGMWGTVGLASLDADEAEEEL